MYIKVSEKLKAKYSHVQACSAINLFLFWGWSIIYNQQTLNYYDKHGPKIGWTPLFVTGKFTDWWLQIWCLGLRLWYGSGSCVFLWGGLLPHEVEPFNGEQWICVMSFLHQSVWEGPGMQPASSKIKITEPVKPLIIRIGMVMFSLEPWFEPECSRTWPWFSPKFVPGEEPDWWSG